jgi:hypothetical protein
MAELPTGRPVITAFAIVAGVAAFVGVAGALLGAAVTQGADLSAWRDWQERLGLRDLRAFVIVAYLHAASYLGAGLGLICAVVYVKRNVASAR